MVILGVLLTFTSLGVGGLALILETVYRLFQEGEIRKAFYKQLAKALAKKGGGQNVPIEHLLD